MSHGGLLRVPTKTTAPISLPLSPFHPHLQVHAAARLHHLTPYTRPSHPSPALTTSRFHHASHLSPTPFPTSVVARLLVHHCPPATRPPARRPIMCAAPAGPTSHTRVHTSIRVPSTPHSTIPPPHGHTFPSPLRLGLWPDLTRRSARPLLHIPIVCARARLPAPHTRMHTSTHIPTTTQPYRPRQTHA